MDDMASTVGTSGWTHFDARWLPRSNKKNPSNKSVTLGAHIITFFAKKKRSQQCDGVCASDAGVAGLGNGSTSDGNQDTTSCDAEEKNSTTFGAVTDGEVAMVTPVSHIVVITSVLCKCEKDRSTRCCNRT